MNILVLTIEGYQDIEMISFIGAMNGSNKGFKFTYWNPDNQKHVFGSNKIGSIEAITTEVDANKFDAIYIPGGQSCLNLRTNTKALELIKQFVDLNKYIFAICDAPNALVENNILLDKKYSSYPIKNYLQTSTKLRQSSPTTVDGKYITANGPATSIDLAILVVSTLFGKEEANNLRKKLLPIE